MEFLGFDVHDKEERSGEGVGLPFAEVATRRYGRREVLKGMAGAAVILSMPSLASSAANKGELTLGFTPIAGSSEDLIRVAEGYSAEVLIRWGDPILPGGSEFVAGNSEPSLQASQFGYNCDYVGYIPKPGHENKGVLAVNHEYTDPEMIHPNYVVGSPTADHVNYDMMAHGLSVIEVEQKEGKWTYDAEGPLNRRFTAETEFEITGPAAGHPMMRTSADPDGKVVKGTIANCAGGRTPWGTILSGEENFQSYFGFAGDLPADHPNRKNNARYGISEKATSYRWENFHDRFHVVKEPNECMRFGWVVEIDPFDPTAKPKKRTALGRFRHEAATSVVTKNDRLVLYSGCDSVFEYVYKYVADQPYNKDDRKANADLLDRGTLYVAKFNEDGTGEWLPLVQGQGPLTPENGYATQGDVLVNTRLAADAWGATKMDRPEDIEVNPVNQKVYIALTNNRQRAKDNQPAVDKANPRPENRHGHVIELTEAEDDHAATTFRWEIFLLCGDPADPSTYFAGFPKDRVSTISCPDNVAFDNAGNLWIATDGMPGAIKENDGFFAVPVSGPERGRVQRFMSSVVGSEVCGPEFTPDGKSVFLAIQHPGEGGNYANPKSRWPDGGTMPPRPSVIVIRKNDGGLIGS